MLGLSNRAWGVAAEGALHRLLFLAAARAPMPTRAVAPGLRLPMLRGALQPLSRLQLRGSVPHSIPRRPHYKQSTSNSPIFEELGATSTITKSRLLSGMLSHGRCDFARSAGTFVGLALRASQAGQVTRAWGSGLYESS